MSAAPIFDLEAEQALLGAMLINTAAAKLAPTVRREDLYGERERRVLDAIVRTLGDGASPDATTVSSRFGSDTDMRAYVRTLPDLCQTATNAAAYLETVRGVATGRRMRTTIMEMQAKADSNGMPPDELHRWCGERWAAVAPATSRDSALRLAFVTAPELVSSEDEPVEWVVPDYIAKGATTQATGQPKVGKTLWAMCLSDCVARGREFMGRATTKGVVVYLSEQTKSTFKVSARGTGLLQNHDVHVLLRSRVWANNWTTIIREAVAYCLEVEAVLLIIDTLGRWAGLVGEAENNSGDALDVMQPLEEAAAAGLAVLVLRHERKSPGADIVDAGRGSNAYAGAFDQLLALQRVGGAGHDNRRKLSALGRFDETPKELIVEYENGSFVARGSSTDVESSEVRATVLAELPNSRDDAWTFDDMLEACGETTAKTTLERVLGKEADPDKGRPARGLIGEGLVRRAKGVGSASKRAYGYWISQDGEVDEGFKQLEVSDEL
jgi:hypothetical protein